jgi:hypothetical protein
VAGHGEFEAAAERLTMNRHDYWLGAVFDFEKEREKASARAAGGHLAEFFDVGSGDKGAAGTDYYCGFDCGVADDLVDCRADSFGYAGTKSIYRRVVDGDDRDLVVFCDFY